MGTSFIRYKEEGFWANDHHLIQFASELLKYGLPEWIPCDIRKYYVGLSQDEVGVGCITLYLDELLTSSEQLEWYKNAVAKLPSTIKNEIKFRVRLLSLLAAEFKGKSDSMDYYWNS